MTLHRRLRRSDLLVGVAAGLMQLMVLPIGRPLILPDEAGFLLNARRLGTGSAASGLDYFPGYSVLLAPLTWISTDLTTLTRLVQLVNGALAVCTALLAMTLARRFVPTISEINAAATGLVVAAYPAYRLFAAFALSENLLVPWTLLLCLAFCRATRREKPTDALTFGVLAGLSLSIHTRALALPLAALLAAAIELRGRSLLGALTGLVVGTSAAIGLVWYAISTPVSTGAPRTTPSSLLGDALSPSGAVDVLTSAAGQVFYLVIATAGLAGLGLWSFIGAQRRVASERDNEALRVIGLLAILVLVASLGISSLFLAGREGDFAIYGRYGEGVLVPVVVAGLTSLLSQPCLAAFRIRRLVVCLPVLAAALVIVRGPEAFQGRTLLLNIAGVFPVVDAVGSIRLSTITLFGVCFLLGSGALMRKTFAGGSMVLAAVFLAFAVFSIQRSAEAIEVLDRQDVLLDELANFDDTCIALDIWQLAERWHQENYRLSLDQQHFEYWSSSTTEPPCADLVVSQRSDLDDVIPGASVIAVEPFGRQALWVLPGPLQDVIDASDDPSIASPLDPLPAEQQALVTLDIDTTVLTIGTPIELTAVIENLGPLGFFPQEGFASVAGSVNLGLEFQLVDEAGVRRHEPFRVRLTKAIGPEGRLELVQTIRPEAIDPTIVPGSYLLVASLVQEGIGWTEFDDAITVEIRG